LFWCRQLAWFTGPTGNFIAKYQPKYQSLFIFHLYIFKFHSKVKFLIYRSVMKALSRKIMSFFWTPWLCEWFLSFVSFTVTDYLAASICCSLWYQKVMIAKFKSRHEVIHWSIELIKWVWGFITYNAVKINPNVLSHWSLILMLSWKLHITP
jgi:hypothetical protein